MEIECDHGVRRRWGWLCVGLYATLASGVVAAPRCERVSGPLQTTLVELYTSEGCSSCPPADRWLSRLKGRPDVLAAAFHVDYWDRLGWKDRFASAQYTARQAEGRARSGARFSYTPQVLVNGQDWKRWPDLPAARPAQVRVTLVREADLRVTVRVEAAAAAPSRLGLWWAVLEDGHVSHVRAGENAGVTLRHDHVVRATAQLPPRSGRGRSEWTIEPARTGDRSARLLVVVTDGDTGAPLQAAQLDC